MLVEDAKLKSLGTEAIHLFVKRGMERALIT